MRRAPCAPRDFPRGRRCLLISDSPDPSGIRDCRKMARNMNGRSGSSRFHATTSFAHLSCGGTIYTHWLSDRDVYILYITPKNFWVSLITKDHHIVQLYTARPASMGSMPISSSGPLDPSRSTLMFTSFLMIILRLSLLPMLFESCLVLPC